jgi:hypothetical protein
VLEPGADFAWLALLPEPRPGSVAVSAPDGGPAGHLVLVVRRGKPDRDAVRVAPEVVGPGPALAVSLVLPPRGSRPLFDDRRCDAGRPARSGADGVVQHTGRRLDAVGGLDQRDRRPDAGVVVR